MNGFRFPEAELREQRELAPSGGAGKERDFPGSAAMMALMNARKYTSIPTPAFVIFANPHSLGRWAEDNTDPAVRPAATAYSIALAGVTVRQIRAVEQGVPAARVITLPAANHYVFLSNEEDVLREIRLFISRLH